MNKAENKPENPVVDDTLLGRFFASRDDLCSADALLEEEEAELLARLKVLQAERKLRSFSVRLLDYVDVLHNGIAMTVRPMVVDLVTLLNNPNGVVPPEMMPPRQVEPDTDGLRDFAGILERSNARVADPKPEMKPAEDAQVLVVCRSLALIQETWLKRGGILFPGDPTIQERTSLYKALVLGFESGWYVCGLLPNRYEAAYQRFDNREEALTAAYGYAIDGGLSNANAVPPELVEVREQMADHERRLQAWRKSKQAEARANGGMVMLEIGASAKNPAPSLHIWHA